MIRTYVYAAHRFGEWLSKQGLPLSAVSDQLVRRYIDQFDKRVTSAHPYGQRSKLTRGLGHLLVVLRQEAVIVAPQQISSPMEQWLARYDQYLNQVGGKAAATRKKYLSYARRFWEFRFGSAEANWGSDACPYGPKPLRSFTNGENGRQEAARRQFSRACVVMY